MMTTAQIANGSVLYVGNNVGATNFVPHRDVLEAFSHCKFDDVTEAKNWLLRFRNVSTPMSRSMLISQMRKQHGL